MKHKGADGVGDYVDAFRPVLQAVLARFSVLPLNLTRLQIMSTFPRPLYTVTYCQETATIKMNTFLRHRAMKRALDTFIVSSTTLTFIVSSNHFTERRRYQHPKRDIRRGALFLDEKAAKLCWFRKEHVASGQCRPPCIADCTHPRCCDCLCQSASH